MRKLGLVLITVMLLMASTVWGYSFLDMAVGSEVFGGSARCQGMGQVRLLCETTPLAARLNPALLARLGGYVATASYRLTSFEDRWSLPTYDSFDALLGYTCYSHNSNLYHRFAGGFATGPLKQLRGVALGVALADAYDFSYDFHEEVRDRSTTSVPSDKRIADALIDASGSIMGLTIGLGRAFNDRMSVGLSLEYLFGDFDIKSRLTNIDLTKMHCWDEPSTEAQDTFKAKSLSGTRLILGATYKVNKRLEVALKATTRSKLEGDYTASDGGLLYFMPSKAQSGKFDLTYPSSYAFGFTYRPRNELLTVIEGNARYMRWSEADNTALQSFNTDDTIEFNIGVEHVFYNGQPVRFGFLYRQSPLDNETSEAAVTAGSGFMVGSLEVSFSGKVGWRDYRYFDLFDDSIFCAESREFTDRVEETWVSGLITVSRRF